MEWEEKQKAAENWVDAIEKEYPTTNLSDYTLEEALYTFSELGLWKADIDIKQSEEAIRIWAVVESVKRNGFPDQLKM